MLIYFQIHELDHVTEKEMYKIFGKLHCQQELNPDQVLVIGLWTMYNISIKIESTSTVNVVVVGKALHAS